jgi:membrane-bound lytic murein transglycosylase F
MQKEPEMTPWGTVVGGEEAADGDAASAKEKRTYSLGDIIENGEIIVLTVSGPDTYYDYHGHGLGVQYMMCEQFADKIGVAARVELCKDTAEMVRKLGEGYGDVIAVQLPIEKWASYPNHSSTTKDGKEGGAPLRFCGAYDKKRHTSWAVSRENTELADSFDRWFTADLPAKTLAR